MPVADLSACSKRRAPIIGFIGITGVAIIEVSAMSTDALAVNTALCRECRAAFRHLVPSSRYFNFAADAVRTKHILDGAAKLVGNQIADHGRAVSGRFGCNYRRTAGLPPFEHELTARGPPGLLSPAHHNPAM